MVDRDTLQSENPARVARRLAESRIPVSLRPSGFDAFFDEMELYCDFPVLADEVVRMRVAEIAKADAAGIPRPPLADLTREFIELDCKRLRGDRS